MITSIPTRGFSLIETVVTIALTTVIMLTISGLILFFYRTNATVLEQAGAIASARRGIEGAMGDLRETTYAEDGAYPIQNASPDSITFYADIDSDTSVEKITYERIGDILYKSVVEPTGTPLAYTQPPHTSVISDHVRNEVFGRSVFEYFDTEGNDLGDDPVASNIAFITASIVVNINPDRAPEEFTLTSSATLRNIGNK